MQEGSPTIDAGATDPLTGMLDLDRAARPHGAAIDIGAYERHCAAQRRQNDPVQRRSTGCAR